MGLAAILTLKFVIVIALTLLLTTTWPLLSASCYWQCLQEDLFAKATSLQGISPGSDAYRGISPSLRGQPPLSLFMMSVPCKLRVPGASWGTLSELTCHLHCSPFLHLCIINPFLLRLPCRAGISSSRMWTNIDQFQSISAACQSASCCEVLSGGIYSTLAVRTGNRGGLNTDMYFLTVLEAARSLRGGSG